MVTVIIAAFGIAIVATPVLAQNMTGWKYDRWKYDWSFGGK